MQEQKEVNLNKASDDGVREVALCKDGHCSGTLKTRFSRVAKEAHHSLPRFHEDYFGPRAHKPKHH